MMPPLKSYSARRPVEKLDESSVLERRKQLDERSHHSQGHPRTHNVFASPTIFARHSPNVQFDQTRKYAQSLFQDMLEKAALSYRVVGMNAAALVSIEMDYANWFLKSHQHSTTLRLLLWN
jgi:hypothetical protein